MKGLELDEVTLAVVGRVSGPKLNLGAGAFPLEGCENHDWHPRAPIDHTFNLLKPWPDDLVNRYGVIYAFHVIEHIPITQAILFLSQVQRALRSNGVFVMEMPHWIKLVWSDDKGVMRAIFGDDRFPGDPHRWGYTPETITTLLYAMGFYRVVTGRAKMYHADQMPCFRVEAVNGTSVVQSVSGNKTEEVSGPGTHAAGEPVQDRSHPGAGEVSP